MPAATMKRAKSRAPGAKRRGRETVGVAAAYPGTPSTEILENLARYEDVYSEWAPNEKVALDVAIGASRIIMVSACASSRQAGGAP